ncbi:MAG TPA: hypothetical protein VLN25_09745 [Burkholderiaceae bacterium]|nr:hypothetical protein [Burkholderiaceae bacterium]
MRLARGLRAVAATVIIGGIAIAALDTTPTTELEISRDAIADPAGSPAIGAPLSADPSAPASRELESPLERIERSMEHH